MNLGELQKIQTDPKRPLISVHEIENFDADRTLLVGGVPEGKVFHVWLAGSVLHRAIIRNNKWVEEHIHGFSLPVRALTPGHQTLPESTDYSFAVLLTAKGAVLSFSQPNHRALTGRLAQYRPFLAPTVDHFDLAKAEQ